MNRNNEYYLELVERWFDAETSEVEEKELKRFLATTEDPAFDEARAAFGYLATQRTEISPLASLGRDDKHVVISSNVEKSRRWLVPALGIAASLAIAFIAGRYTAPVEVVPVSDGSCVSYVHGVEVVDEDFAVATMENTLQDLFSAVPDPGADLTLIFNANE